MNFFDSFGNIISLFQRRKGAYNFGWNVVSASTQFNNFAADRQKLNMVLSNPAVLKVFSLQCDLFSMGYVCVKKDDKEIEDDPFLTLIKDPNPFTLTETQFLWDFMFWNMMGTSYAYVDSKVPEKKGNKMYFLDPSKIQWPQELREKRDKLVFSDDEIKSIKKAIITYKYDDGKTFEFPFDRLVISHDLTNTTGNFFKGPSRLDALYKIISNSEHILDSENINVRYTSKFMVGGDRQAGTITKQGMTEEEKGDIINKMDGERNVFPVNAKINIQRFVDNLANLQLPQEYLHQYFLIGNMYGIPRDVLEAYASSTYENQEKARAAHVDYCLSPKGNQFMDSFEVFFGYRAQGKNIVISWDHLPFVQVFAKEKAETKKVTIEVLNSLLQMGVDIKQANEFLGTEFKIIEKPNEPAAETQVDEGGTGTDEEIEGETS